MKHKPIPWAILLTGVLYYGLLVYWQSDELQMASGSDPYNAAVFGLLFSVVYLAYCMICFQRDLPSSFKDMPFVGRFGKLTGWLAFASIAVYYVRPAAWGGYDEGVGFFLVGIILLDLEQRPFLHVSCGKEMTAAVCTHYAASLMFTQRSPSQNVTSASTKKCGPLPSSSSSTSP